ncbi:MAG: plastocyanin/azurin family copper-binding protein [Solirubrobacteraceae bacterium]
MHTAALQLAPVLAAEKSKVPFYVVGGLLVVWALTVSLGLGLRKPDFPSSLSGQRAVMAITVVLVLGTVSMAVVTSEPPARGAVTQPQYLPPTPPEPGAPLSEAAAPAAAAAPAPASTTRAPAGAGASSLPLAANPSGALSYDTKQLSAKAGTVSIAMTNMSPLEHNVTVAQGSTVLGATPTFKGGTRTLTLKLKPGKYTFYCSVPGHRQAGMEGTLTVS